MTSLQASHELWGLNGPYAWELASALLGPAVLGMTYLSLLRGPAPGGDDEVICFRAGKTGEYGYDLLVPRRGRGSLAGAARAARGSRWAPGRWAWPPWTRRRWRTGSSTSARWPVRPGSCR